jgi:D-sedoheptulose 7-phosphate isomerase
MHFAEELSGNFRRRRRPFAAMALSDVAQLSCTANDFDYASVFSRGVEAHGREGDVLLAISTSGSSASVVRAAEAARRQRMCVIALTGRHNVELDIFADVFVCVAGERWADRVQELHLAVAHIWVELIERELGSGTPDET